MTASISWAWSCRWRRSLRVSFPIRRQRTILLAPAMWWWWKTDRYRSSVCGPGPKQTVWRRWNSFSKVTIGLSGSFWRERTHRRMLFWENLRSGARAGRDFSIWRTTWKAGAIWEPCTARCCFSESYSAWSSLCAWSWSCIINRSRKGMKTGTVSTSCRR